MDNNRLVFLIAAILIAVSGYFFTKSINKPNTATSPNPSAIAQQISVATSFYPLYFFVSQIGGDKALVQNITPAGAEPHDYDPSTKDIAKIEKSNMLVLNGGVEAWGDKIKENLKGTNVLTVVAGEGLFTQQFTEEGKTTLDPHLWLDPSLAKKEVEKITQGYNKVDPNNSSYYQDDQKKLNDKLDQLDQEYRKGLSNCQNKDIITSHAAFGYLATKYGLNQVPISGLSPDAEPSSQQLAEVVKFAKARSVNYIFFESLVSPKLSETIANEIGAKTLVLNPLEGLTDDEITSGKDYFSVMRDNLKNLQTALKCT